MAFEPYLSERMLGDRWSGSCNGSQLNPACEVDERRQLLRDRWNLLRSDPCQRPPLTPYPSCNLVQNLGLAPTGPHSQDIFTSTCRACCANDGAVCAGQNYDKGQSAYRKDYKYPKSHNTVVRW